MKTEKQVLEMMEKVVKDLNKFTDNYPDPSNVPEEEKSVAEFALGALFTCGWVLGCDEELLKIFGKELTKIEQLKEKLR
jgi:hypothetical protein